MENVTIIWSSLLGSLGGILGEHNLEGSSSVSQEFWVDTFKGSVSLSRWLRNTLSMGLSGLVVSGMILRLSHFIYVLFAIYLIITNTQNKKIKMSKSFFLIFSFSQYEKILINQYFINFKLSL